MTYIHLSHDMQLYIQAMQIKWNEPQAFDKLILRPGVMHIVQNVYGCIGQLMMSSGLADLNGSAFGRVGSIISQGKPWVSRWAHSGWYLQLSCNHSCRQVSRRGMRSASTLRRHVCILQAVTGWTTSSPDSPHSPAAALRKRGRLSFSTALHSTSPSALLHRWSPQLCNIPLMALPRNGYTIACHDEG